jgi:hypothetical protein
MQKPEFQGSVCTSTSGKSPRTMSAVPSVLALSITWTRVGPASSGCRRSDSRHARTCSRAPVDTTITISSSGAPGSGYGVAGLTPWLG